MKKKNRKYVILLVLFGLLYGGWLINLIHSGKAMKDNAKVLEQRGITDLIQDNSYKDGIGIRNHSDTSVSDAIFPFGKTDALPSWFLIEGASVFPLLGSSPTTENDGTVTVGNKGKRLSFLPIENNVRTTLELYASKEYAANPEMTEDGKQLFLEQDYGDKKPLDSVRGLRFMLDSRLLFIDNRVKDEEGANSGNAVFHVKIFVRNLNKDSQDHSEGIVIVIPLFDEKNDFTREQWKVTDQASDYKTLYTLPSEAVTKGQFVAGVWKHSEVDVLPFIAKGLEKAKEAGYLTNSELGDLYLSKFTMGWNIKGAFDAGFQFSGLHLVTIK